MFQEMMRQEVLLKRKSRLQAGQILGVVAGGDVVRYAPSDPRTNELRDRADLLHIQANISAASQIPKFLKALEGGWLEPADAEIEAVVRSDHQYNQLKDYHDLWTGKLYRRLLRGCLYCLARKANYNLLPWEVLIQMARKGIRERATKQLYKWRHHAPQVPNTLNTSVPVLEALFEFFRTLYHHRFGIPTALSAQVPNELRRAMSIRAACMVRKMLQEWVEEVAKRSARPDGEQYRKEGDRILDLWNGKCETYADFDERNRQESTGLTAALLPMAQEARAHSPQRQQEQMHAQHQRPALRGGHIAQSQSLRQSVGRSQLLARMRERAQSQPPGNHAEQNYAEQIPIDVEEQPSGMGQDHSETRRATSWRSRRQEEVFGRNESAENEALESTQVNFESMDTTQPQEPLQSQSRMELRGQHASGRPQSFDLFQEQLETAAQEHTPQATQPQSQSSLSVVDLEPMEMAAQEFFQKQQLENMQPLGQSYLPTKSSEAISAQARARPDDSEKNQPPQPRGPADAEMQEAGVPQYQELVSMQAEPDTLSAAQDEDISELSTPTEPESEIEESSLLSEFAVSSGDPEEAATASPAPGETHEPVNAMVDKEAVRNQSQPPTNASNSRQKEDDVDVPAAVDPISHDEPNSVDTDHNSIPPPPITPAPIKKCHHCTRDGTKCNGERPCQFCIRYGHHCYDRNRKPAEMSKRKGEILYGSHHKDRKRRLARNNVEHEQAQDDEAGEIVGDALEKAQEQRQSSPISNPYESHDEAGGNIHDDAGGNNHDEEAAGATVNGDLDELPQLGAEAEHETESQQSEQENFSVIITKQPSQSKMPPKKQAATQSARKRAISTVTTRAAEQMAADRAKRTLRPRKTRL